MTRSPIRNIALTAVVLGSISLAACVAPASRGGQAYHGGQHQGSQYQGNQGSYRSPGQNCHDCGTVVDIARYQDEGRASGSGAVIGAVVGGLVGNQVGSGSGRQAATVAGAVAGGVAGHQIEQRSETTHEVHVRLDSGRMVVLQQSDMGRVRIGSQVRIVDGRALLL